MAGRMASPDDRWWFSFTSRGKQGVYGFDHARKELSVMSVRKSAGAGSFDELHAKCDAPLMASSIRPILPVNQLFVLKNIAFAPLEVS